MNTTTICVVSSFIFAGIACSSQPTSSQIGKGPGNVDAGKDQSSEAGTTSDSEGADAQMEKGPGSIDTGKDQSLEAGTTADSEANTNADGSLYETCPVSGQSCPQSCTRIVGQWVDRSTGCLTGEEVVGCVMGTGLLDDIGSCYVYLPTGAVALTNYPVPPVGNPVFPGDWRECTADGGQGNASPWAAACVDGGADQ